MGDQLIELEVIARGGQVHIRQRTPGGEDVLIRFVDGVRSGDENWPAICRVLGLETRAANTTKTRRDAWQPHYDLVALGMVVSAAISGTRQAPFSQKEFCSVFRMRHRETNLNNWIRNNFHNSAIIRYVPGKRSEHPMLSVRDGVRIRLLADDSPCQVPEVGSVPEAARRWIDANVRNATQQAGAPLLPAEPHTRSAAGGIRIYKTRESMIDDAIADVLRMKSNLRMYAWIYLSEALRSTELTTAIAQVARAHSAESLHIRHTFFDTQSADGLEVSISSKIPDPIKPHGAGARRRSTETGSRGMGRSSVPISKAASSATCNRTTPRSPSNTTRPPTGRPTASSQSMTGSSTRAFTFATWIDTDEAGRCRRSGLRRRMRFPDTGLISLPRRSRRSMGHHAWFLAPLPPLRHAGGRGRSGRLWGSGPSGGTIDGPQDLDRKGNL